MAGEKTERTTRLPSIPVVVEGQVGDSGHTDNLVPVLIEIEQALQSLVSGDGSTVIDLTAMPFSQQDEADLRLRLGRGEIKATLDALGATSIEETGFAGVWLVEHQNATGQRLTLHIEIARVPEILMSPAADIEEALTALRKKNGDGTADT